MEDFLFKKQVDWSVLKDGFTLPISVYPFLRARPDLKLEIGESRIVQILINGESFTAKLVNANFSREKFAGHKEIIQIRYSVGSLISQYFRKIFAASYQDIFAQRALSIKRVHITSKIPEYFYLYATDNPNVFVGKTITAKEIESEKALLEELSEPEWENSVNALDPSANIIEKTQLVKLRMLDRSIADGLKSLYKYRCQICGCSFYNPYNSNLIHAHHIDPFVKSQNNNPENIMILCPNHHGIVHDVHPEFDFKTKVFHYPNGYTEALKVNFHL